MKKIISALLIMTLVFTTGSFAYAETEATKMKGVPEKSTVQSEPLDALNVFDGVGKSAPKVVTGGIELVTVLTGKEVIPTKEVSFAPTDVITHPNGWNVAGFRTPDYTLDKGVIRMQLTHIGGNTDIMYDVRRVSDGQKMGGSTIVQGKATSEYNMAIDIPQTDKYYIQVCSFRNLMAGSISKAMISAAYIKGAQNTILKNKKQILIGQKESQTDVFKYKAESTGNIKVISNTTSYVTLCNKTGKKSFSKENWLYPSSKNYVTYGVKKGKTYTIKVRKYINYTGAYAIKVRNTKITGKGGSKKSTAKTVKKKKLVKGTITAGSGKANWYKFKLRSDKKATVSIKGDTNDRIKIALYHNGKKVIIWGTEYITPYNGGVIIKGKFAKGTWHVKIVRDNKYSSGWYSLKWR